MNTDNKYYLDNYTECVDALYMAILIIKLEMIPIPNHPDPLAIQDVIRELEEVFERSKQIVCNIN